MPFTLPAHTPYSTWLDLIAIRHAIWMDADAIHETLDRTSPPPDFAEHTRLHNAFMAITEEINAVQATIGTTI